MDHSSLEKMSYLSGVLKETLRLHPPAIIMSRVLEGPFDRELAPPGSKSITNVTAMIRVNCNTELDSTLYFHHWEMVLQMPLRVSN